MRRRKRAPAESSRLSRATEAPTPSKASQPAVTSRRAFLGTVSGAVAATIVPPTFGHGVEEPAETPSFVQPASKNSVLADVRRADRAYQIRLEAARMARDLPEVHHVSNGDEQRNSPTWVSYSKGLPHDHHGEASPEAYGAYRRALATGESRDFDYIPLGGYTKLANPQAAFAFDLIGPDSQKVPLPAPPAFASAEQAGEMVEDYWHALSRDIPFEEYDSSSTIEKACQDLSRLSDFCGPRQGGRVTPYTIFRGPTKGDVVGPYVSQFLWLPFPLGSIRNSQKIRTAAPGVDYLTKFEDWLPTQNGGLAPPTEFDPTYRFIRNGRDLGEWVHRDFTFQAFLDACLVLFRIGAPLDGGIPYQHARAESGFVTLGASDLLHLVVAVANVSLKAAWFHKWLVHRRIRPEEFGARVHNHFGKFRSHPLHDDLRRSSALEAVKKKTGGLLLPMAYPEGCPTHPAYPAGHAVIAGACATVVKACFAESYLIPQPVVASREGLELSPYRGAELTVGGEIDKLASNIAIARNFAGVHWRSDGVEGLKLGEAVAIEFLRETKLTVREPFDGFQLTRFDGTRMTIR